MVYSIYRKKRPFLILTIISFVFLSLGFFVNFKQNFENLKGDLFILVILFLALILFSIPLWKNKEMLKMTRHTVSFKGKKELSWYDVKEVWIENRRGYRGGTTRSIIFYLKDDSQIVFDKWAMAMDEDEFFRQLESTDFEGEFGFEE